MMLTTTMRRIPLRLRVNMLQVAKFSEAVRPVKISKPKGARNLDNFVNITLKSIDDPFAFINLNPDNGISPEWIRDFVDQHGQFEIEIVESKLEKISYHNKQIYLEFTIVRPKDASTSTGLEALDAVQQFFGCGKIVETENSFTYKLITRPSITGQIIPFFKQYPLKMKEQEFMKFRIVNSLIKKKEYQTLEGIGKIEKVKAGKFHLKV
jgi:hypothetical protein